MEEKRVDEQWKDRIEKEKDQPAQANTENHEGREMPPVNFSLFISSLGMQALMALGEIENPSTNKKEKELTQAKYLIDIIEMLQQKTKNNLDEEESKIIEGILYELRMKYIAASR